MLLSSILSSILCRTKCKFLEDPTTSRYPPRTIRWCLQTFLNLTTNSQVQMVRPPIKVVRTPCRKYPVPAAIIGPFSETYPPATSKSTSSIPEQRGQVAARWVHSPAFLLSRCIRPFSARVALSSPRPSSAIHLPQHQPSSLRQSRMRQSLQHLLLGKGCQAA